MYNYRLVYISCSCVYFTPQYLGVNLSSIYSYIYVYFYRFCNVYISIYVYIMCKLLHFCWVYVEDNEGQEANEKQLVQCYFFPGCSHLPFPGCLWVRSPPIVTSTGSMGWTMRLFRCWNLQSGPKNATNYRIKSRCHSPYILVYFRPFTKTYLLILASHLFLALR